MNKILIVAFSALLCLAIVQCLKCNTCSSYMNGKCKEGEGVCETHFSNMSCSTVIFKESKEMIFDCGLTLYCDTFYSQTNLVPFYFTCCDTDFCNVVPHLGPDGETSTAPSLPENP
ncbi:sperm acrosomal protein FSA-ACR.1-like isoform X2 [Eublepharis macularius]|uniref:Sperm acrosomal protein FSA-ACR.1-like isoform X2 n=1 Tax=Eublepharis macularius TaxID=481883 RepID=A0AA97J5B9_EUBMA|nr:sperm acrosomal protein FSA-ACR.1-like isoform X2 [Eublepharis macularius]